jgi:hypothetical protein
MSISCQPNKPQKSYQARVIQDTNRNLGLSPVFNVNTEISPCIENFVSPTYPCNGNMCEPITGLTIGCPSGYTLTSGNTLCISGVTTANTITVNPTCLHNLSEVSTFDVTFDLSSGNTMYTGYTGEFCYQMINSLPALTQPPICIAYDKITGGTVTRVLNTNSNISPVDNSYRVRSWNKFESKCANTRVNDYVIKEGVDDDDGFRLVIDTSQYVDTDNDCYFVTITNPPSPTLEFVPVDVLEGITFVNYTLPTPTQGSNQVLLDSTPIGGKVQLTVNGLNLSQTDYEVDSVDTRLITLLNDITFEETDVISAIYNTNIGSSPSGVVNNVKMEFFSVTGITTGVTSSISASTYENVVNYNDSSNRLEIYLQDKIDPSVQPRLTINGVNLAFNVDFFKSNIVQNKLILNEGTTIEIGDAISVYYYYSGINNPGDLGIIQTDTPRIDWTSQQNILRTSLSWGEFIVEVADRDDPSFSNILNSGTILYNNGTTSYTLNVGPITTTNVSDYLYRIKFIKNFVTTNPTNTYTTYSYSDVGSFRLDWSYINNTNF